MAGGRPLKRKIDDRPFLVDPMEHEKLVVSIALRFHANSMAVRDSWQYSAGMCGLLSACREYREETGNTFSTFATPCIVNAIRNEIPRHMRWLRDVTGLSLNKVHAKPDRQPLVSEAWKDLRTHFHLLSSRQRRLLFRTIMYGDSQEDAGRAENPPITKQAVQQNVAKAIEILQVAARGWSDKQLDRSQLPVSRRPKAKRRRKREAVPDHRVDADVAGVVRPGDGCPDRRAVG